MSRIQSVFQKNLDIVGLTDVSGKMVKEFSLGMKQRLGIARSLLHHPEFLILDEPTNGLEPIGIKEVRELILDLCKDKKVTVLISSHILSEVQQLADTIGIIHKGKLLEEISYSELQKRNRHYLQVRVDDDKKAAMLLEQRLNLSDYSIWEKNILRIYERLNEAAEINSMLVKSDIRVKELTIKTDSLGDYFVRLTGGEISA
ncbi:MAG: ATP-binding cassette domain-containing protein [Caulobacteraceae bacterium]